MRTLWYAGLLLLTGMVLFACQSGDLNVGQSIINPQQLQVQSIDTVTLQSWTVIRPDSFVTSSDANLVIGRWADTQTGVMTARSFAGINYTTNSFGTATNLRLDSLVLELNYAFAYGDTLSLFDLSVNPLSKPLLTQTYYNNNSVDYTTTPLFRKSVYPQPLSRSRQVTFRFTDALAQAFYAKLVNGEIDDVQTLSEFFPGFAFNCNSKTNAFVGFIAANSGLRLYYHTTDIDVTESNVLFPFSVNYFTNIQNDRTGTVLSALKNRSDVVSSRLTNNTTFIVPGAQIQTRIVIPYLDQFARPDGFADLNKALLVVSPIRLNFNDNAPPPAQLALYFTNTQNDLLPVALPGGAAGTTNALASYTYDPNALTLTDTYAFDLTYYLGQIIKRKVPNQPLILTIPATSSYTLQQWIRRVTIGDQQKTNDQMQVKLFLTSSS